MFIDSDMNSTSGAPAERNVPAMVRETDFRFRSAGARRDPGWSAFYKHLAPNGAKATMFVALEVVSANDALHLKVESTNGK